MGTSCVSEREKARLCAAVNYVFEQENAKLRDALALYADPGYWTGSLVKLDRGFIARNALGSRA